MGGGGAIGGPPAGGSVECCGVAGGRVGSRAELGGVGDAAGARGLGRHHMGEGENPRCRHAASALPTGFRLKPPPCRDLVAVGAAGQVDVHVAWGLCPHDRAWIPPVLASTVRVILEPGSLRFRKGQVVVQDRDGKMFKVKLWSLQSRDRE